jgi:serine/threonine-protein kinase HipA
VENLAEVRLWGSQVGALAYNPLNGISTFEYSKLWREKGVEIAPLHMPLSAQKYQFPGLSVETYRGLPAVFADVLPDDFGNAVINAWLAREGRDNHSFTVVERLLYTGKRGMGAIEFAPAMRRNESSSSNLELNSLVEMAQNVLDSRVKWKQNISTDKQAMSEILQVGTSAGGARAKAVVALSPDRKQIRSGQVDAPPGFEHYLLKFDGVQESAENKETFGDPLGYGRMEFAYYLMAKDAEINISESELLLENNRAHFITKRFDRIGNQKRHYVSLCAMDHADFKAPGAYSYEQLLSVARSLRLSRDEAIEIFKRMVFNVVARNHDDHTKNFGFILDSPSSTWRLAPAFDIAYSYKKGSPWVNSHQMSINGKRDQFKISDLLAVASLIGNFEKKAPLIIDRILEVVGEWRYYAKQAKVFDWLQTEVEQNLRVSENYDWS